MVPMENAGFVTYVGLLLDDEPPALTETRL